MRGAAQKNLSKDIVISEPFPELSLAAQSAAANQVMRTEWARSQVSIELAQLARARAALLFEVFGDN